MKALNITADRVELSLSLDGLDLLRNGLNEALLAVKGEADFETRLGVTRDTAAAMIDELIETMERMWALADAAAATQRTALG